MLVGNKQVQVCTSLGGSKGVEPCEWGNHPSDVTVGDSLFRLVWGNGQRCFKGALKVVALENVSTVFFANQLLGRLCRQSACLLWDL